MKKVKKKMTLREMYEGCYNMWKFLAKFPGLNKSDYLFYVMKIRKDNYLKIKNDCYACEYVKKKYGSRLRCDKCPFLPLWSGEKKYNGSINEGLCETLKDSPYNIWCCRYNESARSKAARKISSFCRKELKKIQDRNDRRREKI